MRSLAVRAGFCGLMLGAFALGCGTADGPTDKGEESDVPVDGKLDSWGKPTDHGSLKFGVDSQGELAQGALFHVWGFTLSDSASVNLATKLQSANLDTVMYLYRRSSGASSFGAYLRKNDDFNGQITSRLEGSLEAGEYRVLIKGFK